MRCTRAALITAKNLGEIELDRVRHGHSYEAQNARVRTWAKELLHTMGVRVLGSGSAESLGPAPKSGRVIVANHRSMLDVLVVLSRFGGHLLARGDLATWPAIGRLARVAETLYVDRSNPTNGAASIRAVSETLSRGHTVTVFAEGTTFSDDEVREFHAGAFVAALRAQAEVIPLGLAYAEPHAIYFEESFGVHLRRLLASRSTNVSLRVGGEIDHAGLNAKRFAQKSRESVQGLVTAARESLVNQR